MAALCLPHNSYIHHFKNPWGTCYYGKYLGTLPGSHYQPWQLQLRRFVLYYFRCAVNLGAFKSLITIMSELDHQWVQAQPNKQFNKSLKSSRMGLWRSGQLVGTDSQRAWMRRMLQTNAEEETRERSQAPP
jgi:hypothetical protein